SAPAERRHTATIQPSPSHFPFPQAGFHSLWSPRIYGFSPPPSPNPSRGEPLRALRAVRVRVERKGIRRAARQTIASGTFRWPAAPVQAAPLRERTQRLVAHPAFAVRPTPADFPVWGRWRFEPELQQTSLFLLRRLRRRRRTARIPQPTWHDLVPGATAQARRVQPAAAYQCHQW